MPGLGGLEVAAAAALASPATHIVFVTAYNQYAVDAVSYTHLTLPTSDLV